MQPRLLWFLLPRVEYTHWQWILFAFAAAIIGMSKCGIPGIGILNVVIFQYALLAKDAVGFGLPLLIVGDVCAAYAYQRHAQWSLVWKLCPWMMVGVVVGCFALGAVDNHQARLMIGCTLLLLMAVHVWRARGAVELDSGGLPRWIGPAVGGLAGFVSMIANAAGPIMIVYLLAMRMPKMAFMGTSVYFFMMMNLFKMPFLAHLGLVDVSSLIANAKLVPFVALGGFLGFRFAKRVNQKLFDRTAFWLTLVGVGYMIYTAFESLLSSHG